MSKLTDKQEAFVQEFMLSYENDEKFSSDTARLKACSTRAGYSETTVPHQLFQSKEVVERIVEYTNRWAARNAPKAQGALNSILDRPTQLGAKVKLEAARDVLDRSGVTKKSQDVLDTDSVANILCVIPTKQPIKKD